MMLSLVKFNLLALLASSAIVHALPEPRGFDCVTETYFVPRTNSRTVLQTSTEVSYVLATTEAQIATSTNRTVTYTNIVTMPFEERMQQVTSVSKSVPTCSTSTSNNVNGETLKSRTVTLMRTNVFVESFTKVVPSVHTTSVTKYHISSAVVPVPTAVKRVVKFCEKEHGKRMNVWNETIEEPVGLAATSAPSAVNVKPREVTSTDGSSDESEDDLEYESDDDSDDDE